MESARDKRVNIPKKELTTFRESLAHLVPLLAYSGPPAVLRGLL
mgnify:CR=1 FL=1